MNGTCSNGSNCPQVQRVGGVHGQVARAGKLHREAEELVEAVGGQPRHLRNDHRSSGRVRDGGQRACDRGRSALQDPSQRDKLMACA